MADSATLSVRLNAHDKAALEKLAKLTGDSKSKLAAEAIRAYVEMNEWQIKTIRQRLRAADRQEYANRERVRAVFKKWGVNAD